MGRRVLDNADWGFESSCFVCDRDNGSGLRIAFEHDDEAGEVAAEFTLGAEFSGAPRFAHGGIVMAVLDDAMAWAAIAVGGRFAVTRESTTTFHHGVRIGRTYRVEAHLVEQADDRIEAEAAVVEGDERGRLCASARAVFAPFTADQARAVIGGVQGPDTAFLRPSGAGA